MNRNTILVAVIALFIGLWSGLVVSRAAMGTPGPLLPFASSTGPETPRSASARRAGPAAVDGMAFVRLRYDTDGANPKACLEFSQPLSTNSTVRIADFIRLEPAAPFTVEVADTLACIAGLPYETDRQVTILEGLPAQDGAVTRSEEKFTLSFGDRPAFVGFAGNGTILPRNEADGIGLETVNVSKIGIEVWRVNDRILSQSRIQDGQTVEEGSWQYYDFANAGTDVGQRVYQGEIDVAAGDAKNQTVTTVFALGAAIGQIEPGAYVVKVRDISEGAPNPEDGSATPAAAFRWILYTDLAIQSFRGADGLDVVVRSLETARPVGGVTLTLVAQNNAELARVRTDHDGHARFTAPLLDGEGAARAQMVMAYGSGGDYAVMDLDRPALDLTDRNVDGRRSTGNMDAYLYTDRGVYRTGERVRLVGMIRDAAGRAIQNRQSTLVVYRPNGTELLRQRLREARRSGGISQNIDIARGAPRGQWRAVLEVDGQETPAGEVSFSVEDFVPQRLRVTLQGEETPLLAGESRALNVDAQFLYGAPGAGLAVETEARLQVDPNPFPQAQGYTFGKVDETFAEQLIALPSTVTDAAGRANIAFRLDNPPESSLPLRARVTASVSDPGGRVVREGRNVPVRLTGLYLGVRPRFENDRIQENGTASFEVIGLNPEGQATAARGVVWTLVEEDWAYDWYLEDGQWRWRRTGRDIPVDAGTLSLAANAPALITHERLRGGSYRLILRHEQSGAETSYRFGAGWGGAASDRDTPDMVTVVTPTGPVAPGRNAIVEIRPPYAGEAQIVVATDRVLETRTVRVGPDGARIRLRADENWGAGAYVLVTVMTPRDPRDLPAPRRAVGVGYVAVDTGARQLTVAFAEPLARTGSRHSLTVPVTVSNVPRGETVRVAIAAVDQGILQITNFASPDPVNWYFGRRALGVDIRDDYGRLLNPNLGAPATARSGGDSLGGEGLTSVPQRTVALFSDVVDVPRNGRVDIPIDLPDFNGELRLMAVAWSNTAVGSYSQPITVRDPVVAELSLPRFLAPGDQAQAALTIDNVDGPPGRYSVRLAGSGGAALPAEPFSFDLRRGAQSRILAPLSASALGLSDVTLRLEGPSGFTPIERSYRIEARAPYLPIAQAVVTAQPAGQTFTLPANTLNALLPGQGQAIVSYSNLRGIDPGPLLDSLWRYPYGCSEQLASAAVPLLYLEDVAAGIGRTERPGVRRRVQDAITAILDRQGEDGAIGLWRANDRNASPWLGAYTVDFLRRAREAGYVVPAQPLEKAYDAMQAIARPDTNTAVGYAFETERWPGNTDTAALLRSRSAAFALYVLAKAGRADIADLRYFHDARLQGEPSPLARAQIGAALAHMGDAARARHAFEMAEAALGYRNIGDWYQTPVRDLAGVLALAAEARQTDLVNRLAERLERDAPDPDRMTTQEQAAVLLAARTLTAGNPVNVSLNGQANAGRRIVADAQSIAGGLAFRNDGAGELWRTVVVSGAPREAPAAAMQGFSASKAVYAFNGGPVDLNAVTQGDRLVIVVSGEPTAARTTPAVVVDLLPAGFEIETVLSPEDGLGELRWDGTRQSGPFSFVGELTTGNVTEARDDRFVASINLTGRPFRFAYIVRAVTPGQFAFPGVVVEDMYRPGVFGRTGTGRLRIVPRAG
jgi:uncharacterized protein YfaS (alpha-2-macroglobulin family)